LRSEKSAIANRGTKGKTGGIMNHSEPLATAPHEAQVRLLRSERKIESQKLLQLKGKLQATANAKKSVARAA
jgi:hypothetical protein